MLERAQLVLATETMLKILFQVYWLTMRAFLAMAMLCHHSLVNGENLFKKFFNLYVCYWFYLTWSVFLITNVTRSPIGGYWNSARTTCSSTQMRTLLRIDNELPCPLPLALLNWYFIKVFLSIGILSNFNFLVVWKFGNTKMVVCLKIFF